MIILDASALLCLLDDEPGADKVASALTHCVVGAADLAIVVATLRDRGVSLGEIQEALGALHLDIRPLSASQAMMSGDLHPRTKALSLSFSDRACLALAIELEGEIFTSDANLAEAEVGIVITNVLE